MSGLNGYKTLRVLRASSPEALVAIVQKINSPMEVLDFGSDAEGHFLYYRTTSGMAKRVQLEIARAASEMDFVEAQGGS